ncbi:LacI family transcriptional regulator [Paenibacillus psychroresistens]|uniref:LacI family transcriptional regulator n=1 Tax=Paenibacillus psychroresistens TaxID=1778678 RepID=A0A6B8RIV8_9BACL|nr:LacI family DNA-binding transcriptional regulator [Paenibacillus psychroresistens]QGQ95512.1 LacI family transcriptional regulator [Paenibacillus psychroresistens]
MNISIKDIAKALNLSASTVSRALNGSYGVHRRTISRVEEMARSLGYVPNLGAQQLVGKRSNLIGVFMPEFDYEATPDFHDFFSPMHKALRTFGKDVIIFSIPFGAYQNNDLTQMVGKRNLEGCIFLPAFSKTHPIIKEALRLNVPSVNFGGAFGTQCSLIQSDDYEGGRMAGRYLAEKGHRQIAYINGPTSLQICKDRYAGFCEELFKAGITMEAKSIAIGNFSGASGANAVRELWMQNPKVTAIFCANDLMAMGAIMALTQLGIRIPEQVSIVGYDGAAFTGYSNPPLTTVCHSAQRIGIRAAELLLEILHQGSSKRERISPNLVERDSVHNIDQAHFLG